MKILQTTTFAKQAKKLHQNQKQDLDDALRVILEDPMIGELKKGDLSDVRVYKFKMVKQMTLLAYQHDNECMTLFLLALGSHENFYRDLK